MSYQGLDTENQRLQKALENSSKKIQQLEAELQDVETENQTLQRNLEELKISSKRLEQLEQEVSLRSEKEKNVLFFCLTETCSFAWQLVLFFSSEWFYCEDNESSLVIKVETD